MDTPQWIYLIAGVLTFIVMGVLTSSSSLDDEDADGESVVVGLICGALWPIVWLFGIASGLAQLGVYLFIKRPKQRRLMRQEQQAAHDKDTHARYQAAARRQAIGGIRIAQFFASRAKR